MNPVRAEVLMADDQQGPENLGRAVGPFFELLIAPILVLLGGERLMTSGINSPSAWVLIVVGVASFFVGRLWHRVRPHLGETLPQGIEKIASDVRVWGGAVLCLCIYTVALTFIDKVVTLSLLRTSVENLQSAIAQYLLPRHLSHKQMAQIGEFLLHFEPHEVTIKFLDNDQEASGFAMDLRTALMQGGWTVDLGTVNDAREGLNLQFEQTMQHSSAPDDPRHPKANMLLQEALGQKIQIDSIGSGSGINTQVDSLTLTVGRRRRD